MRTSIRRRASYGGQAGNPPVNRVMYRPEGYQAYIDAAEAELRGGRLH